ncbi:MAG: hypothetical protein LBQ20_00400 [Rhodanobacter sp.]|jgi:hypothetical protein|nr:hypothetical protein [Rhodanobacter sp.]
MLPVFLFAAALVADSAPRLEFAGVTLNEKPFSAVTGRFGEAPSWQTGDAAESETKVCYSISTGAGRRYIYFISGELGGGFVNGVRVALEGDKHCIAPQHDRNTLRVAINDFVHAEAVERRLKSFGFVRERQGEWSRCFQEKLNGQTYDNCSSVSAKWSRDVLIKLELWVTESD